MTEHTQTRPHHDTPTLKLAGASYALGDVMMMLAGIARNGAENAKGTIGGGALWLAGGLAAARYGNPDSEKQLQIHADKLQRYLQQKGVIVPDSARERSDLLQQKSLWRQVEDYCYEHPSELLNASYGIGASMVMADGIREFRHGRTILPKALTQAGIRNVSSSFWIGAIVLTGALTGLLIKEDPNATKQAQGQGPIEKLTALVKEKPLRLSGALYTANNGFLALRAWQDFTEREKMFAANKLKPHYASTLQLASYLFANSMLMLSNRDQMAGKEFTPEMRERLENAAVQIIAAQPETLQQHLVQDIAMYLEQQQGVSMDVDALKSALQHKLAAARTTGNAPMQGRYTAALNAERATGQETGLSQ